MVEVVIVERLFRTWTDSRKSTPETLSNDIPGTFCGPCETFQPNCNYNLFYVVFGKVDLVVLDNWWPFLR